MARRHSLILGVVLVVISVVVDVFVLEAIDNDFFGAVLVVMAGFLVFGLIHLLLTWQRGPSIGWFVGLVFILGVFAAAIAVEFDNETEPGPTACREDYVEPHSGTNKAPPKSGPRPIGSNGANETNPQLSFALGGADAVVIRRQAFRSKGLPESNGFGLLGDITDAETGKDLPFGTIKGRVTSPPVLKRTVRLGLCVDPAPEDDSRLAAGNYAGTVVFGKETAQPKRLAALPVTVTVRDDRNWLAMVAVLVGVFVGILVRAAADISAAPGKPADDEEGDDGKKGGAHVPPDPYTYLFSARFLAMLVGGLAGGMFVYGPLFADSPSATVDLFDSLIPLTLAAFTATLAAKSIADLPPPTLGEREKGLAGKPLNRREQDALEERRTDGGGSS